MSQEDLKQALSNWQEQLTYYETELSTTSSSTQQFELRKELKNVKKKLRG